MKLGECAAVTACDVCVYFNFHRGRKHIYSFDSNYLQKEDYINFSNVMKPYLRPIMSGINTLELYIDEVLFLCDEIL